VSNNVSDHQKKQIIYGLHGWSVGGDTQAKWQPMVESLAKVNIELKMLVIPGLDTPLHQVWTIDDYVNWLAATLPNKPVWLLGHSFGGQLSIRFASLHTNRVRGLILIDSAGIRDVSFKMNLKRNIFGSLAQLGKGLRGVNSVRGVFYRIIREHDYLEAPPELRATMSNVILYDVLLDLPKIECQTEIIWGKDDKVTPLWMGRQIHDKLPNSQLTIINSARHSPQFTHHNQVCRLVSTALK